MYWDSKYDRNEKTFLMAYSFQFQEIVLVILIDLHLRDLSIVIRVYLFAEDIYFRKEKEKPQFHCRIS